MAVDDTTPAAPSPLDTDEIPIVAAVPPRRPAWSRTGALGGIAVVLCVGAALSGLGLMFHYRPLVASALVDLVDLAEVSRFGFVRELHRWISHALLIAVALHLFRVVVAGAYHPPRRLNYHVGVAVGIVVVFCAVTGYLLPWDQRAQWLIMLLAPAGETGAAAASGMPGDGFLTLVYALHCGVLPVCGAMLVFYHLKRARRDDREESSAPAPPGTEAELTE